MKQYCVLWNGPVLWAGRHCHQPFQQPTCCSLIVQWAPNKRKKLHKRHMKSTIEDLFTFSTTPFIANNQFKFVRKNLVSLKFSLCVAGNYLETVFCLSWGFFCAHSNDSISSYPPPFLPIFPPAKRSRFDIEAILVFFGKAGWNTYFTLLLEVCDSYGLVFPTPTPPQWCYCVFLLGVFRFIVHPLFYTTDGKKKMAQVQILARTS